MQAPQQQTLEIQQYKTNVGTFIKVNRGSHGSYYCNDILINTIPYNQLPSFSGFAKIEGEVLSVQQQMKPTPKALCFELKDKELTSDKFPLQVAWGYDEDEGEYYPIGLEEYSSLYSIVWEYSAPYLKDIEFKVISLGEYLIEDPSNIKDRKIKLAENGIGNKAKEINLSQVVVYEDIVKLLTPEFALNQCPCSLTSHQMYKITRQYLLENLNMKENVITSNYDFCFTVKKRVHTRPFIVQESYWQGKKLKTKPATKNEKLVEVFEMTWAGYKGSGGYEGYTCIPELKGSSLEDLGEKLESYLSNIVEVLNRRAVECEHCNGTGHLVENVSCKFL